MGARACTCCANEDDNNATPSAQAPVALSSEGAQGAEPESEAQKGGPEAPREPQVEASEGDVRGLAASLAAPRPKAKQQSSASASKGSETKAGEPKVAERRVDPADGRSYTFEEFEAFYQKFYKKTEIRNYWQNVCKPAKLWKKGAKSKAKP